MSAGVAARDFGKTAAYGGRVGGERAMGRRSRTTARAPSVGGRARRVSSF